MDKIVPYLLNMNEVVPTRSKATLLNEMAMALIECIRIYGSKIGKMGKIHRIAMSFWPVRLIPLNETSACICSYLLNKQEKLSVGNFSQSPPKPDTVIKGADPQTFLDSLRSYTSNYLKKTKNYKRNTVVQEALFNSSEIDFFKNFLMHQYNRKSFNEPYFLIEGDPISKSVDQIKVVQDIYDFVGLKSIKMLDNYANLITKQCDMWIQKSSQKVDRHKVTSADTQSEEKKLATLNRELQAEKEKDLKSSPEDLLRTGKYKINDKTPELQNDLNSIKVTIDKLRNAVSKKDLFTIDEAFKDLNLKYKALGNSIGRFETDISNLKKSLARESSETEKAHQKKISDKESQISSTKKEMNSKVSDHGKSLASAEDIIVQIRQEKQVALQAIEVIKDLDLTNVQTFLKNYTLDIKTQNVIVGIPVFIFYFADPNSGKTTERVPVLPILIEKGKVVTTKVKESFRSKLSNLMNKLTPVINLVEAEGDKANLMEMKNLDTRLEDAINDLRIRKILNKKLAAKAKEIVYDLIW